MPCVYNVLGLPLKYCSFNVKNIETGYITFGCECMEHTKTEARWFMSK